MELRHLRYFIAVAEELNFGRAAARLGIQQPPLSLQIKQLEKEMGTPLFQRLTRGVQLTGSGKLLLEEARAILDQIDQAKIDVRRRARGEVGEISVGAAGACYFHPVIGILMSQFFKSYPDVVLSPEESNTPTLIAKLHAGTIDAAFVRSPSTDCEGLALESVASEDTLAVLPENSPFRHAASVSLGSLAQEKFILLPRKMNSGFYDSIIAACEQAGFKPLLSQQAPGIVAVIPMVAAGYGVSLVPQSLSRLRLKGVAYLPIRGPRPTAPINLAYRTNDNSPPVKNLVSLLRRIVRDSAPVKKTA